MELRRAFRLGDHPRIALVGAGGKTTTMFHLTTEWESPVIATTSTHLSVEQVRLADTHLILNSLEDMTLIQDLPRSGVILLTGSIEGDRATGLSADLLAGVDQYCGNHSLPLLIEADGSRQRPIKAPAHHEPPIPQFSDSVVVTVGMSAVGKPLTPEWVHRPDRFSALSGVKFRGIITPEAIIRTLSHPQGGLKNIPSKARRIVLLNQADTNELVAIGADMATPLLGKFHAVVTASFKHPIKDLWMCNKGHKKSKKQLSRIIHEVHEPVAGIILAAGGSRRFGTPKQILLWRDQPLVRRAATQALGAGLSPVIVVCGAYSEEIKSALFGLPVEIVQNPDWEEGQATSVRTGVIALPNMCSAAVFLLADQPHIPIPLIHRLIEVHAKSLAPIVVPWVAGRRGNPVLFDRDLFTDLLSLQGDAGGRSLFADHKPDRVVWDDPDILIDIDTPEDYQNLLEVNGA